MDHISFLPRRQLKRRKDNFSWTRNLLALRKKFRYPILEGQGSFPGTILSLLFLVMFIELSKSNKLLINQKDKSVVLAFHPKKLYIN